MKTEANGLKCIYNTFIIWEEQMIFGLLGNYTINLVSIVTLFLSKATKPNQTSQIVCVVIHSQKKN